MRLEFLFTSFDTLWGKIFNHNKITVLNFNKIVRKKRFKKIITYFKESLKL